MKELYQDRVPFLKKKVVRNFCHSCCFMPLFVEPHTFSYDIRTPRNIHGLNILGSTPLTSTRICVHARTQHCYKDLNLRKGGRNKFGFYCLI